MTIISKEYLISLQTLGLPLLHQPSSRHPHSLSAAAFQYSSAYQVCVCVTFASTDVPQ